MIFEYMFLIDKYIKNQIIIILSNNYIGNFFQKLKIAYYNLLVYFNSNISIILLYIDQSFFILLEFFISISN